MKVELNENEVIEVDYIDQDNYENYIGKTVKVKGYVYLDGLSLTKLPINFTEVRRNFHCSWNQLTSLEGAPEKVCGDFYCSWNQLTSLEGAPKEVGRHFDCEHNPLKSIKGKPERIGGEFRE